MLPYEIEPGALAELLQNNGQSHFVLLDVREPWEVEIGALPGVVCMPMGDVPSRAFAELDPDRPIVTICHHGVRSLNVAAWLRKEGFEQSQSLAGGMDAWSTQVDPSIPRY